VGRPRPHEVVKTEIADGFYGPTMNPDMQSFPSGHTATALGSADPVAILAPPIGVPILVFAGSVGSSRMYKNKHYPKDVLIGAFIGTVFGVAAAVVVRRRYRRDGMLPIQGVDEV
jgi:membrane-associated phospholipid phosphatase